MKQKPTTQENKQYFSILQWITERSLLSEKGEPFSFTDRPWLLDILTDFNPHIVVMACAQVGKSVSFIIKVLFAVKHLGMNVIYTFPTDGDTREFVSSKLNKILQINEHEFRGMDTDSIERKEINGRFLFLKGLESKTAAVSTTADLRVHDESSRSPQDALEMMDSRTKASQYKGNWSFSNPGTERDRLDQDWHLSDMKEWMITCPHCKDEHELSWPESIDQESKCYVCRACKQPLSDDVRRKGKWVAQRESKISGYHISHLMCPWISVEEIIKDSQGDPAYFNNFVLGKPYSPGDVSITKTTLLDIWTPKDLDVGDRFIGIDVGNIKHYTIRTHRGLIKIGRFTKPDDLDDILAFWKPTSGVIDAAPDTVLSRYAVEKYNFMRMSVFSENTLNPQTIVWWGKPGENDMPNNKHGIVYSSRDRILDQMFDKMIKAEWLIGLPSDAEFRLYVKQYETLRREKVVNNKGIERYIWASTTGEDHYVMSDLYAYLAMLGQGSGELFAPLTQEQPVFIGSDNKVKMSLGEMMEETYED